MKLAFSRKNLWKKTPLFLKTATKGLLRAVSPEILLGAKFRNNLKFVEAAQWWPRQKAIDFQVASLRQICSLANKKSPFYQRMFADYNFNPDAITDPENITRLPCINRDTINANLLEMCTVLVESAHVDYTTTGGTSGVPLRFYIGADRSAQEFPYLLSSWGRVGYQLGMPLAVIRGRLVKVDRRGFYHEYDPILNSHYYSNFHMTDDQMERYVAHIKTLGPCFLHTFPSSAACLARFLRRKKIPPPSNIRCILAESENVYPEQREMVCSTFGCPYFSSYGHTEKLVAAAECEKSTHYHVWPTYGYFELVDDDGKAIKTPGQRGEIVGTGFINKVVPFIRYRTGDFATYVGEKCEKCGREHTVLSNIQGHNVQESLVAVDGSFIPWSAVNMHDDTFDHVLQYQMFQDTPGFGILKVVPSNMFCSQDEELILQNLGKKFADRFTFEIAVVKEISLSMSGKAIFVDQQIKDHSGS